MLGLAVVVLSVIPGGALAAGPSFSVAISYTPSASDPLLVTFSATVVPGTPTAYDWAFGDGHYANGTAGAYAAPVHRYAAPGTYNVSVTVFEGSASATQFLPLTLSPATLAAAISIGAQSGTAPFLDTFSATISGGSGTYPSVLWDFGDGGSGSGLVIRYTFQRAGSFDVVLNVTDSLGHQVTARVPVNVSAAGTSPISLSGGSAWSLLAVVAAALGGTIVGAVVVGRWLGRRAPREAPAPAVSDEEALGESASPEAGRANGPTVPAPVALLPPRPLEEERAAPAPIPVAPPATAAPPAPVEASPAPVAARAATGEAATAPTQEALRVSQRIVIHLAAQGLLGPDEVAAIGFTQLGMSQALGARQNALTNVLRRLVAAGVLIEDVRHVRGQPRRLKVYRLTSRGEALARELRKARGPGSSEAR